MTERDLLTVLVPAFNEEGTIQSAVETVFSVAPKLDVDVDVLMIDDASTDGTRALLHRLCERFPRARMLANEHNLGVGRSIVNAYGHVAERSWITVLPGDNEFEFDSIRNFLAVRDQHDVILGYCQNLMIRPLHRRVASSAYAHVANFVYGYDYRYHNGMKMYRVTAFKGIEVEAHGYAFFAELLAKSILRNPRLRVGEVPFIARGRAAGQSKAFRPTAIARAAWEVYRGSRSVDRFRDHVIRGGARS